VTRPRIWLTGLVLVGLVAVGFAGVRFWRNAHRSDFAKATDLLPADTLRASWTDWAGVRAVLGESGLATSNPGGDQIRAFLEKAFSSDLSPASTIDESAVALAANYGFSPVNADWEMFGQSRDGAVMLLKLPDTTDLGQVEDRLEGLGYTRPDGDTGVWLGGEDLLPRIDPTLTPELQYVAVLADQHLVATSDDADYLAHAVAAMSEDTLDEPLVDDVDAPLSATVFAGDFACEDLAMSQADPEEQTVAVNLIEDAGGINPLTDLVVAAYADRRLRVAMSFENDDQAQHNATSRVALASGPAPGQGEDFPDLFTVTSASRDGSAVLLDLHAREGSYALSNLISGPVLFESC
jgi:hypothetical protein